MYKGQAYFEEYALSIYIEKNRISIPGIAHYIDMFKSMPAKDFEYPNNGIECVYQLITVLGYQKSTYLSKDGP